MKKIRKKLFNIISILTLCISFLVTSFTNFDVQETVRTINTDELGVLSFEEKSQQILNLFDSYEVSLNKNIVSFEGKIDITTFDLSQLQFLSTNADNTIKKYSTRLDIENEKFYILTEYIQDDQVIYIEEIEAIPTYDEYLNDYFIKMPDGSVQSVLESLKENNYQECSVVAGILAGLTIKETALLLVAVSIVAYPVVEQVVEVVVTVVHTWVKSFISWFKSLYKKKTSTVTTTTITEKYEYTVSIADTKIQAKPYDKNKNYNDNDYYIAIADTTDCLLYISEKPINEIEALSVLTTSTYVNCANKKYASKLLVVSIYVKNSLKAAEIATAAGTINGDSGAILHTATPGSGYFDHYHPGTTYTDLSQPHAFFGEAR